MCPLSKWVWTSTKQGNTIFLVKSKLEISLSISDLLAATTCSIFPLFIFRSTKHKPSLVSSILSMSTKQLGT